MRILIVDDDPDLCIYLSALLEDHGYCTDTASDTAEALAKVAASPPDLITLDINMPAASGARCYRQLRQSDAGRKVPVIIITGLSDNPDEIGVTRGGVPQPEGFMAKPLDPDLLLAEIKRHERH